MADARGQQREAYENSTVPAQLLLRSLYIQLSHPPTLLSLNSLSRHRRAWLLKLERFPQERRKRAEDYISKELPIDPQWLEDELRPLVGEQENKIPIASCQNSFNVFA